MADIVDAQTRSRMMANIRGKDTKPELRLRKAMHARGFRFRLHYRKLPGHPDLVFPKYRAAVFVHGCFWHRHEGCRYATIPATRPEFWSAKFQANMERDARNQIALLHANWRIAIIWECSLRKFEDEVTTRLTDWIRGNNAKLEI